MHIDYKKYNLSSKKTNIKIIHISDIHFSKNYKLKRLKLVTEKIRLSHPDYVCITGDLIDTYNVTKDEIFKFFVDWIKEISNISKVMISLGNHEYIKIKDNVTLKNYDIDWLKSLQSDNIKVLDDCIFSFDGVTFIGFNPYYDYYKSIEKNINYINNDLSHLLKNLKDDYNILLTHTPQLFFENNNINNIDKVNLILCGHTHGGMLPSFIPGHFGIISPEKKLFPKNIRGKIKFHNVNVIISSGIVKLSEKSKISKYNDIFGTNINEINIFARK